MQAKPMQATYRNVAKMFASALPIEDDEFATAVEFHLATIKRLPKSAKLALRSAYIFSRKVPRPEREDMFQELALAVLEHRMEDERLAYAVARCDWRDWWEKYYTRQHYYGGSLNATVLDGEGQEFEFGELLVGEVDFERRIAGKVDGQRLYAQLPDPIKAVVNKRLIGKPLNATERQRLSRFVKSRPTILVS